MSSQCMVLPHSVIGPSVARHLGRFHPSVTVDGVAASIRVQLLVATLVSNSSGYMPRSGITRSSGNY